MPAPRPAPLSLATLGRHFCRRDARSRRSAGAGLGRRARRGIAAALSPRPRSGRAGGARCASRGGPGAADGRVSAQGGLVEQVVRVLRRTRVFPLFGRGETRLQPVHRSDVARAIVELLGRGDRAASAARSVSALARGRAAGRTAARRPARDQVALMRADKTAADGLARLGIAPQALDTALQGLPASACG